jgi:hypothetical protein
MVMVIVVLVGTGGGGKGMRGRRCPRTRADASRHWPSRSNRRRRYRSPFRPHGVVEQLAVSVKSIAGHVSCERGERTSKHDCTCVIRDNEDDEEVWDAFRMDLQEVQVVCT